MVTSVSMSEQFSVAIKSLNEQKDQLDKAKQIIAEQEKAMQKSQEISSKNQEEIEDNYIPSEDLNKMGVDYYNKHWDSGCGNINHSCSLEDFTNSLRNQITYAYDKDHPDSNCATPPSVCSYLESIDYKKEYEEYKQSRGCTTDEELESLNTTYYRTKEDLISSVSGTINVMMDCLYRNKFSSYDLFSDWVNPTAVVSKLNLQDIANYDHAVHTSGNFKGEASAFKSFADLISKQDNIDEKTKNIFALLSQDITNAKGAIDAFSDEIERVNAQGLSAKSQYNAMLITKYAS